MKMIDLNDAKLADVAQNLVVDENNIVRITSIYRLIDTK